ncbi:unnamed protein product [Prorocentrum cordatum]|uniref:Uncharacterized protein n=1 Tax=Prorocentrum cordatum TaxID=2364126 RepID=A0ABN9TAF0_9DINO|nr:unnamed protein product [Polarella glacialis]
MHAPAAPAPHGASVARGACGEATGPAMAAPGRASRSGAAAAPPEPVEKAQAIVQQLLRLAAELHDGPAGAGGSGPAAPRRPRAQGEVQAADAALQRSLAFLRDLDRQSEALAGLRVPLGAVRHLDGSTLSLLHWCHGLRRRLQASNAEARRCAAPLAELSESLRGAGWATQGACEVPPPMKRRRAEPLAGDAVATGCRGAAS